jgi:glucose-6-phosphate 1-dehydrogenase
LRLQTQRPLKDELAVIGVGRRALSSEDFRELIERRIASFGETVTGWNRIWPALRPSTQYLEGHLHAATTYDKLETELQRLGATRVVFHLALPPEQLPRTIRGLTHSRLLSRHRAVRVVVEKPVGWNLPSAREIENLLLPVGEDRIYRIDHYLGKEGARRFAELRGHRTLESAWTAKHIERIEVRARESLGVGSRSDFYHQTGALRDMVQSHLLQLAALATMEPISLRHPHAIGIAKRRALERIRLLEAGDIERHVVRGQYRTYRAEVQDPRSQTETYVAARMEVKGGQLHGVPVVLETGKALDAKTTAIVVCFRSLPTLIAHRLGCRPGRPAVLTVHLHPDNGRIVLESGRQKTRLDHLWSAMRGTRAIDAYTRLIGEVLRGNRAMFVDAREVETSWNLVDAIRARWRQRLPKATLWRYDRGSQGPPTAKQITEAPAAPGLGGTKHHGKRKPTGRLQLPRTGSKRFGLRKKGRFGPRRFGLKTGGRGPVPHRSHQ